MNNEIKINVPEGMEIDKENSTFECIRFKPKKKELPKTWSEFCQNNPIKNGEFFIDDISEIVKTDSGYRNSDLDANSLPSREYAEAMIALCKLIRLRDCYNDGWKPDWNNSETKYAIHIRCNKLEVGTVGNVSFVLTFKTQELRDTFLYNFKDLIEQAKLLL
jgi:hypothetical protein